VIHSAGHSARRWAMQHPQAKMENAICWHKTCTGRFAPGPAFCALGQHVSITHLYVSCKSRQFK